MTSRLLLALLWLLHWLPLPVLARLGQWLGALLWRLNAKRRRVTQLNLGLCFPHWSAQERERVGKEHFAWLGRSVLERGLLWFASAKRLRKLIHVTGDVHLADRSPQSVMWLVPHFVGLDIAGMACLLFQDTPGASMYQRQRDPVFDAAMRRGRMRFGKPMLFTRQDSAKPLIRCIRQGHAFFNLPDMDFGRKDSAFVPFFGVQTATLLAPSRMARALNMLVQPVVVDMLPGGQGYRVDFRPAWTDFPTADAMADTQALNRWLEQEIRLRPAQYLWVHKRFKTRPDGEPPVY